MTTSNSDDDGVDLSPWRAAVSTGPSVQALPEVASEVATEIPDIGDKREQSSDAPNVVPIETARAGDQSRRRKRHVAAPNDMRPTIHLIPGEIERIVDEAEAAIVAAGRGLYQKDGRIVFVGEAQVKTGSGNEVIAQRIAERGDYALLEDLSSSAVFLKYDKRARGWTGIDPPTPIMKTLRQREGRLRLPTVAGIINTPVLRSDGAILDTPGYDETSGLIFDHGGVEFPPIPDAPTRAEAIAALAVIEDLIRSFPFVSAVDRAVALSAILTAVARQVLPTAPMHAFSAPVAGSGKTKLADIASVIATGHEAGILAQGKSELELEKRLGAALLAGDQSFVIDNCTDPLGGQFLCQMLSQSRVKPRVLGESRVPEVSTNAFVAATGNGLCIVGDATRRVLMSCIDPRCERPELRAFDRDPVAYAKARRPEFVVAALVMMRGFYAAGRPASGKPPLGSFEAWSRLVRDTLLWLGAADPVDSMEALRGNDPTLSAIAAVMAQWKMVIGDERVTAADVARRATRDFRDALLNVVGVRGAVDSRALGNWLRTHAGRYVEGARFERRGVRGGVALWILVDA